MKAIQVYVVTTNDVFVILIIINVLLFIMQKLYAYNMMILKYFIYFFFIRRYRLINFWTRIDAFWRIVYFIINAFFVIFPFLSMTNTTKRASHISLINMISLFLGFHLSFLTDVLGLRLHIYQIFHNVTIIMTVALSVVHVILELLHESAYRRFIKRSQIADLIVKKYLLIKNDLTVI